MGCNDPLSGWKSKEKTALGKRAVTFDIHEACIDLPVNVRCGQCNGCRLDKTREWALRCTHEAELHEDNSFVTLTYDDEHLPLNNGIPTLRKQDFVLFMKRLRKKRDHRISFFQCGEYGELGRPHHHALLFNCGFADRYLWRRSGSHPLYRSEELETLWKGGQCEIGEIGFDSAAYVAGYTMKLKQNLKPGQEREYLTMSRRPAIGKQWIEKNMKDVYPRDEVITRPGNKNKPPRYYDQQLEKLNPQLLKTIQANRQANLTDEAKSGLRHLAREKNIIARSKEKCRSL